MAKTFADGLADGCLVLNWSALTSGLPQQLQPPEESCLAPRCKLHTLPRSEKLSYRCAHVGILLKLIAFTLLLQTSLGAHRS